MLRRHKQRLPWQYLVTTFCVGLLCPGCDDTDADLLDQQNKPIVFVHMSDTHADPFFEPNYSYIKGKSGTKGISRNPIYIDKKNTGIITCYSPDASLPLDVSSMPFGIYGADNPMLVLEETMDAIMAVKPSFIIFSGDLLTHDLNGAKMQSPGANPCFASTSDSCATKNTSDCCDNAYRVLKLSAQTINKKLQGTPFLVTYGNNDGIPKNAFNPPWIKRIAELYQSIGWLKNDSEYNTFTTFGGYHRYMESYNLHIIVLNTVLYLFNDKQHPNVLTNASLASQQMTWFKSTVKKLISENGSNTQIYVVAHEPFSTKNGKDYLSPYYLNTFLEFSRKYSEQILAQFYGDQNLDIMRVVLDNSQPVQMMLLAPGISSRANNNPAFHVLSMNSSSNATISNLRSIYIDLSEANQEGSATWRPVYDFNSRFNTSEVSPQTIFNNVLQWEYHDRSGKNLSELLRYRYTNSPLPLPSMTVDEFYWRSVLHNVSDIDKALGQ